MWRNEEEKVGKRRPEGEGAGEVALWCGNEGRWAA